MRDRGVGTGRARGGKAPKFSEDTKSALFSGSKVPFAFVKMLFRLHF